MHLRNDTYLADIRIAGRSIYSDGVFEVTADPVNPIEIIVGTNGGSIKGIIPDKGHEKVQLLLLPEPRHRNNTSLFTMFTLSESHQELNLRGLAPGDYKVLAIRAATRNIPFRSAEFLGKYEALAPTFTILKGSRVSGVEIPLVTRDL